LTTSAWRGFPLICNNSKPVIFGEPGTNGQQAFFQMLQGTTIVPIEAQPLAADIANHHLLSANCLAQSQALMQGRSIEEVILGKN
jgi:glucose-6-phosphate isomerase